MVKILFHLLWRSLTVDPYQSLSKGPLSSAERYSRRLMSSVIHLNEVLREFSVGGREINRMAVLSEIVGETGAAYINRNVNLMDREAWSSLSQEDRTEWGVAVLKNFENAEAEIVQTDDTVFGFDVHRCHFADLSRQLGCIELAPLFCRADSLFFQDAGVPVEFSREETLADGGHRCAFRFQFKQEKDPSSS